MCISPETMVSYDIQKSKKHKVSFDMNDSLNDSDEALMVVSGKTVSRADYKKKKSFSRFSCQSQDKMQHLSMLMCSPGHTALNSNWEIFICVYVCIVCLFSLQYLQQAVIFIQNKSDQSEFLSYFFN